MTQAELSKIASMASNSLTKSKKDEPIVMSLLKRKCAVLDLDFGDIAEYKERINRHYFIDIVSVCF